MLQRHEVLRAGNPEAIDERAMVVGPWTVPFVARLTAGTIITGARLHPGRTSFCEAQRFANVRPTILLRSAEFTLQMSDLFKT
jgi:hypothetical protein